MRKLRIARAHSPTEQDGGLPIGVARRLPEFLVHIEGDVPGLLTLIGVHNALPGDDDVVVWFVGLLIPRRPTGEDHKVAWLVALVAQFPKEPVEPGQPDAFVERVGDAAQRIRLVLGAGDEESGLGRIIMLWIEGCHPPAIQG